MALASNKQRGSTFSIRLHKRILIQQFSREGMDTHAISRCADCHGNTVVFWQNRDTVYDLPRSGRPVTFDDNVSSLLMGFYCQTRPFSNSGRWTLRLAATYLKNHPHVVGVPISKTGIHRILKQNNLKPHLSRYFLHISDPDFFPKMAHLISLYNNPPKNLYCFDECPGIQVLQRLSPDVQTEQTKIRLEEFEYIRNGTTDVLALLNVNTGEVFAECRQDHTRKTLIDTFETYFKRAPKKQQLDYIMDNLNSHCCYEMCVLVAKYSNVKCPSEKELDTMAKRRIWLTRKDKRIIFHYTPYHGSWLNQIEYWFGMLNAKCLHDTYHSPLALHETINEFVALWNGTLSKPFKWKYTGKGLHGKAVRRFIEMLSHTIDIDRRLLIKQLKLHVNIINDYWDLVDKKVWLSLNEKIEQQKHLIEYVIVTTKKKKIEDDLQCIKILIDTLTHKLASYTIKAA